MKRVRINFEACGDVRCHHTTHPSLSATLADSGRKLRPGVARDLAWLLTDSQVASLAERGHLSAAIEHALYRAARLGKLPR